jgi:hypothetical protein
MSRAGIFMQVVLCLPFTRLPVAAIQQPEQKCCSCRIRLPNIADSLINMKLITLFVATLPGNVCIAQSVTGPVGAQPWMLGGSSVMLDDVWSVANNPAAGTGTRQLQYGLYSEQRFNEPHLKLVNASVVFPAKYVHTGASLTYYGYSAFNQQRASLSLARSLSTKVSLGVQLNYISTFIEDHGQSGNAVIAAGIFFRPVAKLGTGMMIFNPTQNRYGKQSEDKIPAYARLGCVYHISGKVQLYAEADQWLEKRLTWRGGIYYKVHSILHLSMGMATQPAYYTVGTVLQLRQLRLDLAYSFHGALGFTPHMGLSRPVPGDKQP